MKFHNRLRNIRKKVEASRDGNVFFVAAEGEWHGSTEAIDEWIRRNGKPKLMLIPQRRSDDNPRPKDE